MRLIDADALMENVCGNCPQNDCTPDATDTVYGCMFAESVDQMPTIEAEPVRHGRWIQQESPNGGHFNCSECGHEFTVPCSEMIDPRDYECYLDDYCGGCGAKMDGGADND